MITGVLLVVITWILALLLLVAVGLSLGIRGSHDRLTAFRRSLWWGFAIATVVILVTSLFAPLSAPIGLIGLIAVGVGSAGLSTAALLHLPVGFMRPRLGEWLVIWIIIGAAVYLAVAALGPVTNYDSGLYHLGALRYQQEEGLVHGIANLYFPLGYGNSVIPWSAFLGSTSWGANGFRLFNGLLLVLLAVETIARMLQRSRTPGTYVLFFALLFVWIPMVSLSDYWVTSPTSDSSVLILTTVTVAYFADAIYQSRRGQKAWASLGVAVTLGWVLVSMRPTMVVFSAALVAIAVLLIFRGRARGPQFKGATLPSLTAATLVIGLALAVTQSLRDRILSGWLQYPLSVFSFDVPWRAPNPSGVRIATLGAARDPENLWGAAESWGWIPVWIGRLPSQWESWLTVLLVLASAALVYIVCLRDRGFPVRSAALAAAPSTLAVIIWFAASPPAFRFIWGPLFTLVALPGAFAASSLARKGQMPAAHVRRWLPVTVGLSLLGVTIFSATTRLEFDTVTSVQSFVAGPISIPYSVAPVQKPEVIEAVLASGLTVTLPVESDQCWAAYPLCTAQLPDSVATLSDDWRDGFRH